MAVGKILRSRSGCQRCRIRRKKCDEKMPVCGGCQRLKLHCTWRPTNLDEDGGMMSAQTQAMKLASSGDGDLQRVPMSHNPSMRPGIKNLGSGYEPFRDQAQFNLAIQTPTILRNLISASARSDFRDTSFLTMLALKNGWLRDALASFSAHQDDRLRAKLAPVFYARAVSTLRSHIAAMGAEGASIEVLAAMIFIGMSDSMGTGDPTRAILHFQAAASICKTTRFSLAWTKGEQMFYQLVSECWLYHLSTLSMFHSDCDAIMKCIDWIVLDECFDEPLAKNTICLDSSPFLGGSASVYKLILQVTWYARQIKPLEERQQQKLLWSGELDMMQGRPRVYFDRLPYGVAQLYSSKFLLHISALRIFLEKIADWSISASSPLISIHVEQAQEIFLSSMQNERSNPALAWPLIVFLCAADEQPVFDFFIRILTNINENFDAGHMLRITKALETLREQRSQAKCCLNLLLRKRGILVPDSKAAEDVARRMNIP